MASARVGINQLQVLIVLGSPTMLMPVPGKAEAALVRRGFLRADAHGCVCITAAGLRLLADEMDAGRVKNALELMAAEVRQRREHAAERNKKRGLA